MNATLIAQIVTSGLVTGLIYMLIALGVTLLFGIMRVVNFVHGELVMLSAFAVYFLGVGGRVAVLPGAARRDPDQRDAGGVLPVAAVQAAAIRDPELLHRRHRRVVRDPLGLMGDLRSGTDRDPGDASRAC